ncbi:MAG: CapA family protein, partial [Sphaerobacter sp.]|nr:CapA family protein [Sphaerobacter sp.]
FRVDQSKTPSEVYRIRHDDDRKGFPADFRYWETVVPICHLVEGRVTAIEIVPVSLGHGEPVHRRGRPRLATGEHALAILERFAALSEPFGTRLRVEGERAFVQVD